MQAAFFFIMDFFVSWFQGLGRLIYSCAQSFPQDCAHRLGTSCPRPENGLPALPNGRLQAPRAAGEQDKGSKSSALGLHASILGSIGIVFVNQSPDWLIYKLLHSFPQHCARALGTSGAAAACGEASFCLGPERGAAQAWRRCLRIWFSTTQSGAASAALQPAKRCKNLGCRQSCNRPAASESQ